MIVYENHVMSNPRLPFIFNVTTLVPNGTPVWKGAGNWHENIEIIYIKSGSGFIVIGDRYIPASKGDIIPISSGRLHGMFVSECEMTYYYLIIDRNFFLSNHFDSNNFVFDAPIRNEGFEDLLHRFKSYWDVKSEAVPMRVQHLRSIALELSIGLCERYATYTKSPQGESNLLSCIKKAIGYIKVESNRSISLDEVSNFVGLSKYYFAREFRRITGLSFVTYLNYVRCEKAKELLLLENMSIGEVGRICGFDNQSYFTRTFKECTTYTPKDYRRMKAATD